MYEVSAIREFGARHYLIGGDPGREHLLHDHRYRVEAVLAGKILGPSGYLVDLTLLEKGMDGLVRYFSGRTLNDLPEFAGLNPSLEHFARLWCRSLIKKLRTDRLVSVRVRVWEHDRAWASYREPL